MDCKGKRVFAHIDTDTTTTGHGIRDRRPTTQQTDTMNHDSVRNLGAAHTRILGMSIALLAAVTGLAQTTVTTTTTTTTEAKKASDEPQKLEKYEVTGSRIKRLDVETPAPV